MQTSLLSLAPRPSVELPVCRSNRYSHGTRYHKRWNSTHVMKAIRARADVFCRRFGLSVPILLAPMAGACPPPLSVAVSDAGGMGACGVLMMTPQQIVQWVADFRGLCSKGPFQLNIWIRDPDPERDMPREERVAAFLSQWGPPVSTRDLDFSLPDFEDQLSAMIDARPTAISSIMGVFPSSSIARMKEKGIAWFATASTVKEAIEAEQLGADVIVAQGAEAGGHRGSFRAQYAEQELVGLFSLLPAIVDAVRTPVVAAGGVADARGVGAALLLGASAVQIGTAFLRTPEAGLDPAWANAIATALPEDTIISRAFSGRAGRSIATPYVRAALSDGAPQPAPYPVQRGLTAGMRADAMKTSDVTRMQAWAGQSSKLARSAPAGLIVKDLWRETMTLIDG